MGCSQSANKVVADPKTLENKVVGGDEKTYKLGRILGTGAFSEVRNAVESVSGEESAIKCISRTAMDADDTEALLREVAILRAVYHPHIVNIVDFFEDAHHYFMVTEKMVGGELFDRIVERQSYNEGHARDLVKLLTHTIHHLHSKTIVHRDLKPENLLLQNNEDDAHIKIADFGLAMFHRKGVDKPMMQPCGSPGYVAPEIVADPPVGYDNAVDVWSIGVITYILLCGYPPFQADDQDDLFDQIRSGDYHFDPDDWEHVSKEGKNFIEKILVVNPAERATAYELQSHPWMSAEVGGESISPAIQRLKEFKARARWKSAINTTRSVVRMNLMMKSSIGSRAESTDGAETDPAKNPES
jgi:serine/threonine protein kinase